MKPFVKKAVVSLGLAASMVLGHVSSGSAFGPYGECEDRSTAVRLCLEEVRREEERLKRYYGWEAAREWRLEQNSRCRTDPPCYVKRRPQHRDHRDYRDYRDYRGYTPRW